jgi:hypothetical protein
LNLRSNPENFAALPNSLARDPVLRARILVADLWDSEILHAYDRIVFGSGMSEFAGLNEVFTDPSSEVYMDKYIRRRVGREKYRQPSSTVAVLRLVLAMLRWGLIRHAAPVTLSDWPRAGGGSYAGEIWGGRAVLPDV